MNQFTTDLADQCFAVQRVAPIGFSATISGGTSGVANAHYRTPDGLHGCGPQTLNRISRGRKQTLILHANNSKAMLVANLKSWMEE